MYIHFKRLMDIVFSTVALLVLSPVLILTIIILRLTGEREVFYFQKRLGYNNREFEIIKFATMLKNSPNIGSGTITLANDPRVTKFGRILRITKINELPQIFNIIRSDMSLVGPRPLPESDFSDFPYEIQLQFYNIKPGLTGIGSLVFRDEEKYFVGSIKNPKEFNIKVIAPYKGDLELWYKQNISFLTDLKILFLTFWSLVSTDSELVYRVFKNLPPKPRELSVQWINSVA